MFLNAEREALLQVAKDMALAARTAPKGRGKDNLVTAILEPAEIERVAAEMERLAAEHDLPGFKRDASNLRQAPVVLLLGSKVSQMGLKYCGLCGFENCEANTRAKAMCAFVPGDLGIAVGSAVAIAADRRADSRIMYSVGMAVLSLKLLSADVRMVFGIPLSATGKNPFFDRKA